MLKVCVLGSVEWLDYETFEEILLKDIKRYGVDRYSFTTNMYLSTAEYTLRFAKKFKFFSVVLCDKSKEQPFLRFLFYENMAKKMDRIYIFVKEYDTEIKRILLLCEKYHVSYRIIDANLGYTFYDGNWR